MRLIYFIFFLLVAVLGLMTWLLIMGGPETATGLPHPSIDGMSVGGDGLARLAGAGWLAGLIQCLTLVLIYSLIALGVARRRRSPLFWTLLGIGCAISLAIWALMYTSYMDYLTTGSTDIVFGFPRPTAFMLFGVFLGGCYLCGLYIWGFRRFVFTDADELEYEALRAEIGPPRVPEEPATGRSSA
jgi:hypothetical protein